VAMERRYGPSRLRAERRQRLFEFWLGTRVQATYTPVPLRPSSI